MQPDRFAREIVCILALSDAARSRRLMRNPLGRLVQPPRYISRVRPYAMIDNVYRPCYILSCRTE
jgi:hypothetical protein